VQGKNLSMDQIRKEEEVKVKDLVRQLEGCDPEADIVLKAQDGRETLYHQNIRVYAYNPGQSDRNRITIDGYNPEK
jgi:hypothetical protein